MTEKIIKALMQEREAITRLQKKFKFSWRLVDSLAINAYQTEEVRANRYCYRVERYKEYYEVIVHFDDGTQFSFKQSYIAA